LFLELGPQETKVSLRSRSSVDVREIAERLGGGGHRAAAGVRFPGPLIVAEPTVLDAVRAAMNQPA
jgi:phosphoesterase RecJ-like protein